MKTNENKVNNVKANESANVSNESATAKVENESNVTNNVSDTDNESTDNESTDNESTNNESTNTESNESNATDESKPQATATAPTAEQIAAAKVEQKHMTEINNRYKLDAPTEVEKTKFAGAYVLGVWRAPKDVKKNGDKTFFKIYFNGKIYDGYTATEFCDTVGIERKHRAGNTPKVTTMLDKLQALKAAIEAVESNESDFVNFAKIVAKKIESEQIESERSAFVAKYEKAIDLFDIITEAACAEKYGDDVLALAKKLGYKFSDTKQDTSDTSDTTESKANDNK